jgi:DNA-binding NarL/FixJ family response regulator
MKTDRIRILLVDDHPVVLRGLTAMLEPEPEMQVVGCATSGSDAVRSFQDNLPDITVMDLAMKPGMSGIEATAAIRREFPDARIIILTVHAEEDAIYRALQAGATTYLLKDTLGDDLVRTIREVHSGRAGIPPEIGRKYADRSRRPMLTQRETGVLRLMAEGLRNKEIAARLGISEQTVLTHVRKVLAKLQASDRTGAVATAFRLGIIDPDE